MNKYLDLIKNNPVEIGKWLGFTKLTKIHNKWLKMMMFEKTDRTLLAHRGSFKCQSPNTMIMMADYSSKRLGDIEVGEYVMGWDETPRKVLSKYSGIAPMYRVSLNKSGEYYDCNNNHILTMRQRPIKNNKFHCVDQYRYGKDKNIINIPIEDFINSKANKTTKKDSNDTFFKHFKVPLNKIPTKKVNIPPYVLGLWLGDGASSKVAITCDDKDIEHIKEFKEWCLSFNDVKEHIYRKENSNCATYVYNYGGIIKIFKEYNLYNNKHIPNDFLHNNIKNRLELLAGLLDSDGSYGNGHFIFTNKNEKLAKQVEWLARSLGFHSTAKKHTTYCTYKGKKKYSYFWQVYINGNIDEIPNRIPRKKAKEKKVKVGHLSYSQTITKIDDGEFVGITIEGDGMFLMDNFLVVHNTTCLSIAIALLMIIKPSKTIMFIRKTDDDIKEIIRQVAKLLKSETLRYLCLKIHGCELKLVEENSTQLTTNLMIENKGTSQLFGTGIKASLTGKHYDIVITDDIVNTKDRTSKAEREETKRQYQELQNIKNVGGRILNCGTKWHKDDCIEQMPNIVIYDCYSTGLLSGEEIALLRDKMTSSLFSANYELKHIASEDILWTNPRYIKDNDIIDESFVCGGYCHIDASYGGEDKSAMTIAKKVGNDIYILGFTREKHIDDCIDEFISYQKLYKTYPFDTEKNADKGYLAKEIRRLGGNANIPYHEDMNKYVKCSTFIKRAWGNLIFLENCDKNYISEILEYNEFSEHDDEADSLASILRRKFYNRDKEDVAIGSIY